jgi:hypothetical protein
MKVKYKELQEDIVFGSVAGSVAGLITGLFFGLIKIVIPSIFFPFWLFIVLVIALGVIFFIIGLYVYWGLFKQ